VESPLGRVLIVDDEIELMKALRDGLARNRFDAVGVTRPQEALDILNHDGFDLLITDLMMPEMDGIELLKQALLRDPQLVGIIMTGHGTIPTAIEAMKSGAYDYILKPFKMQTILPILHRGLEVRRLKMENVRLRQYVERLVFESTKYTIIGISPAIQRVLQLIEKVAPTDATVLIRGPSGSGKELVARALHFNSPRKNQPLVTVNCATLQESLLESELFGHEKGAFTGAVSGKPGLFEVAEGGTLFIDEVAEMSPAMQAKLLRVLEYGHYRKVGGTQERLANVRIIAATNKPLEQEQKAGRFREDLFYRLNVFHIALPALKERREDIPILIEHFLTTRQYGPIRCTVTPEAMAALIAYDWPGNIRELANVLERAQILADNYQIRCCDLPESITDPQDHDDRSICERDPESEDSEASPVDTIRSSHSTSESFGSNPPNLLGERSLYDLDQHERQLVCEALNAAHGNKVLAAKLLGISRRSLYRLIEKHHLES
jgi:DNA-binding NtrC family response regulator